MKVLEHYYILNQLDLPTIEWQEYVTDTELSNDILWSVKVENGGLQLERDLQRKQGQGSQSGKNKKPFSFLRDRRSLKCTEANALIGVDRTTAIRFATKKLKTKKPGEHVIYYPYYTVEKSGIIDMNRDRIVLEATSGDISNLEHKNQIEMTMIFEEGDLIVHGNDQFLSKEEVLPLIDYGREVRKMMASDIDQGKNVQLVFGFLYQTNECLKPVGEKKLLFHRIKLF